MKRIVALQETPATLARSPARSPGPVFLANGNLCDRALLETYISQALYGISYGLLLFMLAAGLTLIFSMMGVLNFAHASFYMLGAYFAISRSAHGSASGPRWWSHLAGAVLVGALVERWGLRRVHKVGPCARTAVHVRTVVHHRRTGPGDLGSAGSGLSSSSELDGPVDWLLRYDITFPEYRMFMMAVAIGMLVALGWC